MQNNVETNFLSNLDSAFAQLSPQAVEEFYAAYQQWSLQQRIRELRQRIDTVRAQREDNEQCIQQARPSAISLAALARLQSNGVSDIALLDALLERGESWLDQTMQRLDYFEQFDDFIADDYTQWCQGALEGAFDWIDSLRDAPAQDEPLPIEASPLENSSEEILSNSEDTEDVEALLLQRLAIEDKEDDLSWLDAITLKRTAIQLPAKKTTAPLEESEQAVSEEATPPEAASLAAEYIPQEESVAGEETPADSSVSAAISKEEQIIPEEVLSVEETGIAEAEQATSPEIAIPDNIPAPEDTSQSEVSEPGEAENDISEEVTQHEQQAIATGEPVTPVRRTPPKRGFIRQLIWIFTGK